MRTARLERKNKKRYRKEGRRGFTVEKQFCKIYILRLLRNEGKHSNDVNFEMLSS